MELFLSKVINSLGAIHDKSFLQNGKYSIPYSSNSESDIC